MSLYIAVNNIVLGVQQMDKHTLKVLQNLLPDS